MSAGDYELGDTVYLPFTTRAFATGVPTVLAGSPVIEIYEDASVTQITAAETLVVSIDSIVGFNMCSVVATSGNGFGVGQSYTAIISTGTVGGVSVVGEVIGHFTVEMSAAHLRLGAPAGASVSADIADVPTVSEFNARTIVSADYFDPAVDAVANVTLVATTTVATDAEADIAALNNISMAQVNTEVDTALSDINLDHFVGTATAIPALPAGTYLDLLQDDGTAVYSRTTDSLQAIRDHVGDGTNLTETGGTGNQFTAIPWNAAWDAEVESECTDAINALFNFTVAGQADANAQYWNDTVISTTLETSSDFRTEMDDNSTKFATLVGGIIEGLAETGTLSTTQATTSLTGFVNDELIGRVIVFTGGTADGQASAITDYASASGLVTYDTIITAPINNDPFKIV